MCAVEPKPVRLLWARVTDVSLAVVGIGQAAVRVRIHVVVVLTKPRMTLGNSHVTAQVAETVAHDHAVEALVLPEELVGFVVPLTLRPASPVYLMLGRAFAHLHTPIKENGGCPTLQRSTHQAIVSISGG